MQVNAVRTSMDVSGQQFWVYDQKEPYFKIFVIAAALSRPFSRLLTESKQEEFIQRAQMLIRLEKYGDAVSIGKNWALSFDNFLTSVHLPPIRYLCASLWYPTHWKAWSTTTPTTGFSSVAV